MDLILNKFKEKGIRITKPRKSILNILFKATIPLLTDELNIFLQKENMHFNKSTIYRELRFLQIEKIIEKVDLGDRKKRYMLSGKQQRHLVCLKCKSVEDVLLLIKSFKNEEKRIEKMTQFKIKNHSLEFYGFCKKCQLK